MSILKPERRDIKEQTDKSRRSFMWKVGAGMSAVLAASVPAVAKSIDSDDSLKRRVAALEDEKKIRSLHQAYENLIDRGEYSDALDLFTEDAEIVFNGGLFKGKKSGIKRLLCDHFRSGRTGKKMEPAPGFELSQDQHRDIVKISKDQESADAMFTYSIQVGAPIESDSLLVKMAKLQGEGVRKWWEGGVYKLSCVKSGREGAWKIKGLEYNTLSSADYRQGKPEAKPIDVSKFSDVYPVNSAGPDRLV